MFSFHKPKIYRSNLGCCICKAKSSSSRFTDSQKYENEFERCFRIKEKRSGEICNACVLLVKRWKKLSPDNRLTKHWHHVVDARAGPGTKLTTNRRITNHQSSGTSSKGQKSSSADYGGCKSDVLPLCSSQAANNQASGSGGAPSRGRASSFSKARAIDTNISTFTFGEPPSAYRRSYMNSEATSYFNSALSPPSNTPGSFFGVCGGPTKPQSALNSSAFESVIKRFRQRQQQQHLEAQRRQQNRLQRLSRQQLKTGKQRQQKQGTSPFEDEFTKNDQTSTGVSQKDTLTISSASSGKLFKRLPENYGSLTSYESLKVGSVLDSSIWRKEKVCCGIIFRGLFNEVAIFPKLLKPCECRSPNPQGLDIEEKSRERTKQVDDVPLTANENQDGATSLKKNLDEPESPPPRETKSGSVSSSTSGTGSMEQSIHDETLTKSRHQMTNSTKSCEPLQRMQPVTKRPRYVSTKRRRLNQKSDDGESSSLGGGNTSEVSSKSAASADSPSSGSSSSRIMLLIDGEEVVRGEDDDEDDDLDDHEHELVSADEDAMESSNDASSTAGSLVEIESKNALAMG